MARRYLPLAVVLMVWAALPFALPRNLVDLLVFSGIYAVAGLGVSLLLGHCGIVNLAQAVFYGIGAYATAYLTVEMNLPSVMGFVVGALVSTAIAFAVGWPVLRLTGYFLALATMALSIIGNALFYEWDWLTQGTLGIGGIPKLQFFGFVLDTPMRYYYLAWVVAFACMAFSYNLTNSRTGLMLRAMRDSTDAAISLGVDIQWLRTRVFMLSALFGSIAGNLFAHYTSFVSVQSFTVEKSFTFLLIAVLGGVRSPWGAAVGAVFITLVPEYLSRLGDFHQILFGLALVCVVVFLPGGLAGALGFVKSWLTRARSVGHAK
ncbi:MAG: branched-chain amino acid ABC transporter permease [Xanthobacteraceae bacterium]